MTAMLWILGKNVEQGAQTIVHACLAPRPMESLNGKYVSDCREEWLMVSHQVGNRNIEEVLHAYTNDLLRSIA